ncbi:hypothetical protein SESBI_10514 [Sesbania bispinosa]|nr:hypothetical protein SESBI_10514 [Sesbania bispinosa]
MCLIQVTDFIKHLVCSSGAPQPHQPIIQLPKRKPLLSFSPGPQLPQFLSQFMVPIFLRKSISIAAAEEPSPSSPCRTLNLEIRTHPANHL